MSLTPERKSIPVSVRVASLVSAQVRDGVEPTLICHGQLPVFNLFSFHEGTSLCSCKESSIELNRTTVIILPRTSCQEFNVFCFLLPVVT